MNWFPEVSFAPEDGGGSATPSAASPESVQPSTIEGGGTLESGEAPARDDFNIPENDDLDSVILGPEGGRESVAAQPLQPPPAGVGTAQPPAPVQPLVAAQPQAPVQQPVGAAPGEEITIENVDELLRKDADAYIENWAQSMFALSEDEVEKLTTNPEQVLPRLMAKTLFHALSSIPAQIRNFVPGLIQKTVQQTQVHSANEEAFFADWPGLRQHGNAVVGAISAIRANNPAVMKLPKAQAWEQVAKVAAAMVGLDAATLRAKGASAGNNGAGPMRGGNGAPVAPPFRPAGAGSVVPGNMNGQGNTQEDWFGGFDLPNG